MIYADHDGIRTDAVFADALWLELFEEKQERACRLYGNGAAFVVKATHESVEFYESTRERIG